MIERLTLVVCILINMVFAMIRPDYFALFIAASFYLNMYYFITLLLPTNLDRTGLPAADLSRFHAWLKEIGITTGATQFTRLFINALFMNSRALSLGIGLIFSIDIVYTLIHMTRGLPPETGLLVIVQCAIIVIFYLLVWRMEPFSTNYIKKVEQAKHRLTRKNLPPRLVTGMFIVGFLLAIVLFLTTIIILPGVTVSTFLDESNLTELGHLVALLVILAASQYFIVRYIHGITSRTMADRLFDYKENSLEDLIDDSRCLPMTSLPAESPVEMSAQLLESKIFFVRKNTLAGIFPVYVVDLDFSVMMDNTTMTAIRGYIHEREK